MDDTRPARDYTALRHEQRVAELQLLQRRRAELDAEEARLLHAMHLDSVPNADGSDALDKMWVREDVACTLRIAPVTATVRLLTATDLVTRLPNTLSALADGAITVRHAHRLVEELALVPDEVAAAVEARVLANAAHQTVGQLTQAIRRAVHRLHPVEAEQQAAQAHEARRVILTPQPSGTSDLFAQGLSAAGAAALAARLQADARTLKDQDKATGLVRTADQRRADALVNLALATTGAETAIDTATDTTVDSDTGATTGAGTGCGGVDVGRGVGLRPAVQVTVALSTLLGLDEQPGELAGHGPIPADVAREIAHDPTGTWRRLLTDQHGRLIDVTSHTYRPPAPIARLVRLQHPTCRFPGCGHQAVNCELDHIIPWPDGPTTAENLQPLCQRHHHLKHEAGWHVKRDPENWTTWTSPSGHTYPRPPDDLPDDTTSSGVPEQPDADDPPPF